MQPRRGRQFEFCADSRRERRHIHLRRVHFGGVKFGHIKLGRVHFRRVKFGHVEGGRLGRVGHLEVHLRRVRQLRRVRHLKGRRLGGLCAHRSVSETRRDNSIHAHWDSRRISASRTTAPTAHRTWASTARRTWEPARKAISESGARQFFTKSFLGENAAVLAESSSERRRWRGGHDSAGAATRRINSTLGLASIFGMSKDGALNDGMEGASSFGACARTNP